MKQQFEITGNVVDIFKEKIYPAIVRIREGVIVAIEETGMPVSGYLLPGLVDSHIHIESSMVTPAQFAWTAVKFGTVATVSDPHEIANVMGIPGVEFMVESGKSVPLKFFFGAPSCVPATGFETSGSILTSSQVDRLLSRDDIFFLSEMMNFPGVIHDDPEVIEKINSAKKYHKKVDGHAPGLRGASLEKYIQAGIQTDHECSDYAEALEKIQKGMIIQIREGSAARNFDNLYRLIDEFPDKVMLCSDDLHPNDLLKGHLNRLLSRGIAKGLNIFNLIRAVSKNPVLHYNLNVGLLKEGDPADIIRVRDLNAFEVMTTIIDGNVVYDHGKILFSVPDSQTPNRYFVNHVRPDDLNIRAESGKLKVIDAVDGELITHCRLMNPVVENGLVLTDTSQDILKILVLNRYHPEKPAVGYIHNFGLKYGAMASTIAHDSHNIIAVGTSDRVLIEIIDWINTNKGGIAFHNGKNISGLPLPIGGILSNHSVPETARAYETLDKLVKDAGTTLNSPFMTLSFMALLVIPKLKIGNKGLFDVEQFQFTSLFEKAE